MGARLPTGWWQRDGLHSGRLHLMHTTAQKGRDTGSKSPPAENFAFRTTSILRTRKKVSQAHTVEVKLTRA